jgi:hypothetical protein
MVECKECGKKLSIFKGYRHPTLGKKHLVCSGCFDITTECVEEWKKFILPYFEFFNPGYSNDSSQLSFEKIGLSITQKQ